MKVSDLQRYLAATLEKFGDVECLLDVDAEDEDLYTIEGVFCDVSDTDPNDVNSLIACYEVRATLSLVK